MDCGQASWVWPPRFILRVNKMKFEIELNEVQINVLNEISRITSEGVTNPFQLYLKLANNKHVTDTFLAVANQIKTQLETWKMKKIKIVLEISMTSPQARLLVEGKFPVEVTRAGYAVIRKKPIKTNNRVCTKCGFKSDGKHKKCNNVLEDKSRCNGDWNGKLDISFETQFFVDQISTVQQDMVLETVNEVNKAITHEIFTPNLQSCIGTYGKCVYYSLCHDNNMTDYIKEDT